MPRTDAERRHLINLALAVDAAIERFSDALAETDVAFDPHVSDRWDSVTCDVIEELGADPGDVISMAEHWRHGRRAEILAHWQEVEDSA